MTPTRLLPLIARAAMVTRTAPEFAKAVRYLIPQLRDESWAERAASIDIWLERLLHLQLNGSHEQTSQGAVRARWAVTAMLEALDNPSIDTLDAALLVRFTTHKAWRDAAAAYIADQPESKLEAWLQAHPGYMQVLNATIHKLH